MKTKSKMYLLAVTAAALSLASPTSRGQVFDSVEALNNRAIAASPRAREAFPWLSRIPSPSTDACCDKGEAKSELSEAKKNRAYAASPRVREMFPELGRSSTPRRDFTVAAEFDVPASVRSNAIANSPRSREEFPALTLGATSGTAMGGPPQGQAIKVIKSGK